MFNLATPAAIGLYLHLNLLLAWGHLWSCFIFLSIQTQKDTTTRANNGFRSDRAARTCVNVGNGVDNRVIVTRLRETLIWLSEGPSVVALALRVINPTWGHHNPIALLWRSVCVCMTVSMRSSVTCFQAIHSSGLKSAGTPNRAIGLVWMSTCAHVCRNANSLCWHLCRPPFSFFMSVKTLLKFG